MATDIYKACSNPVSGETFKTISFDKDAYVMQWTVQPKGYVPFEHIHLNQDEIFHVQKGEIRIVLNRKERIAKAGETISVPKGTAHIAYNNQAAVLDCIVAYKPGLDHDLFMQCLMGLTNDRYIDKKGAFSIKRMGYFLVKMKAKCMARPTAIPAPVFKTALFFFYITGALWGWKRLYKKYTGTA